MDILNLIKNKETVKYSIRISSFVAITVLLLTLLVGAINYKVRLLLYGIALSEILWFCWFKPFFGKSEERQGVELLAVLIFRSALLLACVLGLTMGL